MKKICAALAVLAFLSLPIFAQKQPLAYFLPDQKFNPSVPSPEQFFGFQIGEWHVSHDQILAYVRELDRVSDRISLEIYGRSHEQRPLTVLTVTSPQNHRNLLKIKDLRRKWADPTATEKPEIDSLPVVLYQGFSIHGNEASGASAALLYAYFLAAAEGAEIEKTLAATVILLDPCFNPDGVTRFATWANANRSTNLVSDPSGREFNEPWPRGRFNHYLFDLNRDWLVGQQPESVGRIRIFQDWLPNVLTDHHEMGSNSTFFFQPGVPSRVNPLTPRANQDLTKKIAGYHARALDAIGSLYFTEENFDDFYYGKGSTYPDVNGSVGILFEQASSRGHLQETENGPLSFPFTIRNQAACAFSTLRAGQDLRKDLLVFQRDFFEKSLAEGKNDATRAIVFGQKDDPARLQIFVEMLLRHRIEIFSLKEKIEADGQVFEAGKAFAVPMDQAKYRLVRGIFDQQKVFEDSLFYDISAWTLPMAFGLDFARLDSKAFSSQKMGEKITSLEPPVGQIDGDEKAYAWLFRWDGFYAPKLANELLKSSVLIKTASKPFVLEGKNWPAGTIIVPSAGQTKTPTDLFWLLKKLGADCGIDVFSCKTGLTESGIDLGSSNFLVLKKPKIAILSGDGVAPSECGEAWHLLDVRLGMQPTMLDISNQNALKNDKFTVCVISDGALGGLSADKIREFLTGGGTVVATGGALKWLDAQGLAPLDFRSARGAFSKRRPYSNLENDNGSMGMNGSIFEAEMDLTHPLCWGFQKSKLPVFLADTLFLDPAQNAYATPILLTKSPLLAGYAHVASQKAASGSAAAMVFGVGRGKIIALPIAPNFRSFWLGTSKIFLNAVFFGQLINNEAAERARKKE